MLSEQLGAAHFPIMHLLSLQSVFIMHVFPVEHVWHDPPPQSVSVSVPSFMLSVHVAIEHTLFMQLLFWQSLFAEHVFPVMHLLHFVPPQSVSVSS